ncbi:hypothetical protein [Sandarakinorhabdus sp.]|uniref:hypothetical protein n=1 Tax=Sandarakinorhabdus sp. TaxID=1916663 RepID=UPI003F6FCDE7
MTLIRWVFLLALALAFVLLAVSNWTMVPFVLPDGRPAAVPLPLLMAAAFVAGVIPTWIWHALLRPMAGKSRSRRAEKAERTDVAPSLGQPGIVPPAGA